MRLNAGLIAKLLIVTFCQQAGKEIAPYCQWRRLSASCSCCDASLTEQLLTAHNQISNQGQHNSNGYERSQRHA